jgi:murein DD-endopeptidase MepM/ murein hydrolase activator NlpD
MSWRSTFRTAAITATVTSAFWIVAGALWLQKLVPDSPAGAAMERQAVLPLASARTLQQAGPASSGARPPRSAAGLVVPVAGVRPEQLVDTFTAARSGGRRHDAIDIMAPLGTPVVAAASGTVQKLFYSERGGNTVYIRSPDGRTTYYYAHLHSYAPGLTEKRQVRQGEVLGTVGHTGSASPEGPHLHFEIQPTTPDATWWQHGPNLNPYPLLGGR